MKLSIFLYDIERQINKTIRQPYACRHCARTILSSSIREWIVCCFCVLEQGKILVQYVLVYVCLTIYLIVLVVGIELKKRQVLLTLSSYVMFTLLPDDIQIATHTEHSFIHSYDHPIRNVCIYVIRLCFNMCMGKYEIYKHPKWL